MNRNTVTNFTPAANELGSYDIVSAGLDGKPAGVVSQRSITDRKVAVKQANKLNNMLGFKAAV